MATRKSKPELAAELAPPVSGGEPHGLDLAAAALLGVGLLVAASAFSYQPTAQTPNVLGAAGDGLARRLFDALGLAVYVLLTAWVVLVLLMFLRRSVTTWLSRLTGWMLLLPCSAIAGDQLTALARTSPEWGAMLTRNTPPAGWPVAGGGGTLGAWLSGWLATHFNPPGQVLIFTAAFILGLALALDFLLVRAWATIAAILALPSRLFRRGKPAKSAPPRQVASPTATVEKATDTTASVTSSGDGVPIVRRVQVTDADHGDVVERPFELPPLDLLIDPPANPQVENDDVLRERAALLEKTLADFGMSVKVVGIHTGPVITQYEIALETGLRLHKVTVLADDLALNLSVPGVRIVAPLPGRNTVGIEVPNERRAIVHLKELLLTSGSKVAKSKLPLLLGKDSEGRPLVGDLADMPHLLIAGRTGTGKSVCLNTLILSLLLTRTPDEVKLILIDPKGNEFTDYGRLPHLIHPVEKDPKKAEAILAWAVDKMEERYDLMGRARVRNIGVYNSLGRDEALKRIKPIGDEEAARIPEKLPYIVIIIDEVADLIMRMKKEIESHIIRLAQKSRAAGIHLILATQKPTVDVITGLIKSNLPARICFQVTNRTDSMVVLDEKGADKLLGKGDMLFLVPGTSTLIRAQGAYASDEEINRVVGHLDADPEFEAEVAAAVAGATGGEGGSLPEHLHHRLAADDMYGQAVEIVIREGRGSVSLLQRMLSIGYGRAARLIDFMAEDGIVGHYNGSNARDVLLTAEQWHDLKRSGRMPRAG